MYKKKEVADCKMFINNEEANAFLDFHKFKKLLL